jgi:hypothetical protein
LENSNTPHSKPSSYNSLNKTNAAPSILDRKTRINDLSPAEGRHSNMAADRDASAPATSEDSLVQSLTSSSTTKRIQGLGQLHERIKRKGVFVSVEIDGRH